MSNKETGGNIGARKDSRTRSDVGRFSTFPPIYSNDRQGFIVSLERSRIGIRNKLAGTHVGEGNNDKWPLYDTLVSGRYGYDNSFSEVLHGGSIKDLLNGRKDPLVIDLMAPSGTLVDLFDNTPDVLGKRGIAVSLTDQRSKAEKTRDQKRNITQLQGDLTTTRAWKALETEMGGQKADLIIERGALGLNDLPRTQEYFQYVMQKTWGMLSTDNGNLIAQCPLLEHLRQADIALDDWKKVFQYNNVEYYLEKTNSYPLLRVIKTPDSPAILSVPRDNHSD